MGEIEKKVKLVNMIMHWENNFAITAKYEDNEIVIAANKAGLMSLAAQLLALAQDDIPPGDIFIMMYTTH